MLHCYPKNQSNKMLLYQVLTKSFDTGDTLKYVSVDPKLPNINELSPNNGVVKVIFQLRLSVFHSVHRGFLYRPLAHPLRASKGQIIIINQLKSIYNSLFEDSYSHPIHTCFLIIARNGFNL